MTTILVATDGSEHADKALDVACDLAVQRQAELKILHVRMDDKEPAEMMRLLVLESRGGGLLQSLREAANAKDDEPTAEAIMRDQKQPLHHVAPQVLDEIGQMVLADAEAHAGARGLEADILPIATTKAADAILAAAREQQVGTIVMGCRGLGDFEAFALGSISHEVCQKADCTCITVK